MLAPCHAAIVHEHVVRACGTTLERVHAPARVTDVDSAGRRVVWTVAHPSGKRTTIVLHAANAGHIVVRRTIYRGSKRYAPQRGVAVPLRERFARIAESDRILVTSATYGGPAAVESHQLVRVCLRGSERDRLAGQADAFQFDGGESLYVGGLDGPRVVLALLDSGAIADLRSDGPRVTWTNAGAPRAAEPA